MKRLIIILVMLNIILAICVWQNIDYKIGYTQGTKDTARVFAKAELEGKIYKGYPLVLGDGVRMDKCWFISGSNADPIIELYGNDITLTDFYIDMVDTADTMAIQVSPWFVNTIR